MNLFVPEIGSKLKLTSDWTFVLYYEYRNNSMFKILNIDTKTSIVRIPKDTILNVDRIYIRKGVSAYSSVTFTIPKVINKKHPLGGSRFWAKLSDVNNIEFELLSCNEKTLELIKNIDDKTKILLSSTQQSYFMKLLLDGKTINNIRPQESPEHFIMKLNVDINKFKSKHPSITCDLTFEMEKLLRKYKLELLEIQCFGE